MARIWKEEQNLNIFLELLHCSLSFQQHIIKLKAPTVIINSCHEIKETDDPKVPVYLYCILLKTTIFNESALQEYGILTFSLFLQHAIQLFSVPIHLSKEQQKRLSQLNSFW